MVEASRANSIPPCASTRHRSVTIRPKCEASAAKCNTALQITTSMLRSLHGSAPISPTMNCVSGTWEETRLRVDASAQSPSDPRRRRSNRSRRSADSEGCGHHNNRRRAPGRGYRTDRATVDRRDKCRCRRTSCAAPRWGAPLCASPDGRIAVEVHGNFSDLFRMPRFMGRQESGPLIYVQRSEPRMFVNDMAQCEAVGAGDKLSERRARSFSARPCVSARKTPWMQRLWRRSPFGTIGQHRFDTRRQQRRIGAFRR